MTGTTCRRTTSHPDFHRRSWSFTRSTGYWRQPGRGLSPTARNCTDPERANTQSAWCHDADPDVSVYGSLQASAGMSENIVPLCRRYKDHRGL